MALKESVMMMQGGGGWTEERHAAFLNCIEENFVNRMFSVESSGDGACISGDMSRPVGLPLDREIPDSVTESTCDSRVRRTRQIVESDNEELVTVSRANRKKKRQLSQLDTSQDQVVPQMGCHADNSMKKRRVQAFN